MASSFPRLFKVDECILDDQLPKLLIQPFVENSIEHGFVNRSYGGLVEIRIRRFRENGLAISIKDNGQGIDASKAEGFNGSSAEKTVRLQALVSAMLSNASDSIVMKKRI